MELGITVAWGSDWCSGVSVTSAPQMECHTSTELIRKSGVCFGLSVTEKVTEWHFCQPLPLCLLPPGHPVKVPLSLETGTTLEIPAILLFAQRCVISSEAWVIAAWQIPIPEARQAQGNLAAGLVPGGGSVGRSHGTRPPSKADAVGSPRSIRTEASALAAPCLQGNAPHGSLLLDPLREILH